MADTETPTPAPGQKVDTDFSNKGDDKAAENADPRQGLPASVKLEQASTQFDLDKTKRSDPKGQYIQYNGVGTVRIMGPTEWKAAGVDSDDYFEWNYLNNKRIPRSAFSDEQLQYLLRIDDRFELVEVKDDSEAKKDN